MADDFFRKKGMENMRKIEELIQEGRKGNFKAYEMAYKKIVQQIGEQPKNPKFKSQLVKLLLLMKKENEDKKYVERFSREYSLDPVFIDQRMDVYVQMGKLKKAQEIGNWMLEQDLVDSKMLTKLERINFMLSDTEKQKEIRTKLMQVRKQERENEKGRNNYLLRTRLYQKVRKIENQLLEIDLETLEGIDKQEQIEEVEKFLIGSIQNRILDNTETVDNIGVLIDSCMRTKNMDKALQILNRLEQLEPNLTQEEKKKMLVIRKRIGSKKNIKNSIQPYYPEIIKKINGNNVKVTEVANIKQKMNQLIFDNSNKAYKNIVMSRLYHHLGWNINRDDEIKNAEKNAKTEHQKRVLSATLEKMQKVSKETKKETFIGEEEGR